jgi:transcriptional regulator with XRE-family HTH domain
MTERPTVAEIRIERGRLVRRLREEAGMELKEVAQRSEWLSVAELEAIEQGVNREVPLADIYLLAGALGVEPAVFSSVARWEPPTSADDPGGWAWVNPPSDD